MGWFKKLTKKVSKGFKSLVNNPYKWFSNATVGNVNDAVGWTIDKTLGEIPGLEKKAQHLTGALRLPEAEDLKKPLEYFANSLNQSGQLVGIDRDHVGTIGTAVTSIINPYLGAAFKTAYDIGNAQDQGYHSDWGDAAKAAAINFGTAYAADSLGKWADSKSPNAGTVPKTPQAGSVSNMTGNPAAGTQGSAGLASAAQRAAQSPPPVYVPPAELSVAGAKSSSAALAPTLKNIASSGVKQYATPAGMAARQAIASTGTGLVNQALTNSLMPTESTAIDSTAMPTNLLNSSTFTNSPLNLFGGEELLKPGVAGTRAINQDAVNAGTARINAQDLLARRNLMDQFMSWGRGGDYQDSPEYKRQMQAITENTNKTIESFINDSNRYNDYMNFRATNNLSDEDMLKLIEVVKTIPNVSFAPLITPFLPMFP